MNEQWQAFLQEYGASIVDDEVRDFGNTDQEIQLAASGDIFFPQSTLGMLTISGDDACRFLQGQMTNDIEKITAEQSLFCGYCTPKGRLLALMQAFSSPTGQYHLVMPRALVDGIRQRLQMYVLMSRVDIRDDSNSLAGLGLHGPAAEKLCRQLLPDIPLEAGDVRHHDGLSILRLRTAHHPRYALYGRHEVLQRCWHELNVHAAPVGSRINHYLDIVSGIPTILPETSDEFVPQHIDVDRLDGISFDKGCYTGQEIIARLHYRGRSKRRLFRLQAAGSIPWLAGATVFADAAGEQVAGMIVISERAPDDQIVALASLHSDGLDEATLTVDGAKHSGAISSTAVFPDAAS